MLLGLRNGMDIPKQGGPSSDYWGLCFTAEQSNSTVAMVKVGSPPEVSLEYSTDAVSWRPFIVGTTTITLENAGDKVWIKAGSGGNQRLSSSNLSYANAFVMNGKIAASGSIMSLLDGTNQSTSIPTSSGSNYCFSQVFKDCAALTTPPELPSLVVPTYCYNLMFFGCKNLKFAPALPATTLAPFCYSQMFYRCQSITSVELPAPTLLQRCYNSMFEKCRSLSTIKVGATSWGTNYATANWVSTVAASGTFICPTALGTNESITRGISNCPTGWTVINTDA